MKTTIFIRAFLAMVLVGAFISVNTYGKNPVKDTRYPYHAKQIKNKLAQTMKFPDCGMSLNGQGIAEVIFSISADGKIDIDSVTANCKDLEVYVKEQLSQVSFANITHPEGQHYKATFIFSYS